MPDRLEETVAEFIRRHALFAGTGRVLLAVSGGADSITLLHILMALKGQGHIGSDFVCAHVNHQLRGPASDGDERFVVEQARQLGLPVVTRAIEVRAYAQARGLSLETAGRQLRLASLGEIARTQRCAWVCTGHQKDDNAETVLHRLWRGTGFRGLAGIRPVRRLGDLRLASPLLCATRREIVQYLDRRDLRWREDQTNTDIAYTRNYIRHRLLPLLQREAQGGLAEELSELAAAAGRLRDRVERETEQAWPAIVTSVAGEVVIQAPGLTSLPEPVAVELIRRATGRVCTAHHLPTPNHDPSHGETLSPDQTIGVQCTPYRCRECGLARPHYRAILQLARRNVGGKKIPLPNGLLARREGEQIMLGAARLACRVGLAPPIWVPIVIQVPGTTRFAGHEIEARILPQGKVDAARLPRCARHDRLKGDISPLSEYLDLDQVKPPVVVRTRKAGDRFQPLGMADEKKVGKFLTTAKVPRDVRERILIFADRERIIWVCPVRISEQAKITERTHRVLQLTISNT